MEPKPHSNNGFSFSNLFNLESLMNFQLPQQDDDFDYYGNSSQDESRGSQGGAMGDYHNGIMSERELSLVNKKRRSHNSEDEEEDGNFSTHISEERYRSMLGEHIQKYKRRFKDPSPSPAPARMGVSVPKSTLGSKTRKLGNEHRGGMHEVENTPDWLADIGPQKMVGFHDVEYAPDYGTSRYKEDKFNLIRKADKFELPKKVPRGGHKRQPKAV